jgi:hypothetical protein
MNSAKEYFFPYNVPMKILDPRGEPISSFEDWAQIFRSGKKGRHWKEHRSAFSLAKYVMHLGSQAEQLS